MAQIWEYVKIAIANIKSNRNRSILTMLGIIMGISSVIMVISIGNGVKNQVSSEMGTMDAGQVGIYLKDSEHGDDILFTQEDFEAIREKVPNVKGVTTHIDVDGYVRGPKGSEAAYVDGSSELLQYYFAGDEMMAGRYFTAADCESANKVCVVGEKGAKAIYGTADVVGKTLDLTINGITQELTIIGVRAAYSGASFALLMGDEMDVEMPITVLGAYYGFDTDDNTFFYVVGETAEDVEQIAEDSIRLLETRYGVRGEDRFGIEKASTDVDMFSNILNIVTVFVSFVAMISLAVGGVGVMNIMFVSVSERTREIGIRKALGAKTKSIMMQFLAEAAIITLLGGVIGIVLGSTLAMVVCGIMGFAAEVKISTVLLATMFSSAIGIFFGMYPAKKAASLPPIEALRHV